MQILNNEKWEKVQRIITKIIGSQTVNLKKIRNMYDSLLDKKSSTYLQNFGKGPEIYELLGDLDFLLMGKNFVVSNIKNAIQKMNNANQVFQVSNFNSQLNLRVKDRLNCYP